MSRFLGILENAPELSKKVYIKDDLCILASVAVCSWRINQGNRVPIEFVLTYKLYDHKPFCSDYCIEWYKLKKPKKPCPEADESYWPDWKKERKIGRIRLKWL